VWIRGSIVFLVLTTSPVLRHSQCLTFFVLSKDYIQNYVWASGGVEDDLFHNTQRVAFSARDPEEPTQRVVVESSLVFGFFVGTNLRAPTTEEIEGLLAATSSFYTDILQAVYQGTFSFMCQPYRYR